MTALGEWYEEAFRADYLRVYPHRDDAEAAQEVRYLSEEVAGWGRRLPGLERGRRVLDLACGEGRHLRAMGAAGVPAVGADLSSDLLEAARRSGCRHLVRCDMRRLPFREGAFDAVTLFFNSFGYFGTVDEDAAALGEAARVLARDGGLFLEILNAREIRRNLVPRSERREGGILVVEERSLTPDGTRVRKRVTLREGTAERKWEESVRLYDRDEIRALARAAGLSVRLEGAETMVPADLPGIAAARRFVFVKAGA